MADFTRKWLPTEWLDEVVPEPQDSPDAFISPVGDSALELRAPTEPREDGFYVSPLTEGQIVEFVAFDDYGTLQLTIHADRTFETDDPVPAGATLFMLEGEPDTISGSIEEMVRNLDDPIDPGTYTVAAYSWQRHASFRLELDEKRVARFVMCAGAS